MDHDECIASVFQVCNKYFDDEVDKRMKEREENHAGYERVSDAEIKSKDKQNSKTRGTHEIKMCS